MSIFIYILTVGILAALMISVVYLLYRIAILPGEIAKERNHPQSAAIAICGWMGIITLVLWPIALVWAYTLPRDQVNVNTISNGQLTALLGKIREANERIATLERMIDGNNGEERQS